MAYQMIHSIQQIVSDLKSARQEKQLTQRELSEKVKLPQSQISKIENGVVDLRLSSLVELSRALDFELMLVPRKLLPAVQSMTRKTTRSAPEFAKSSKEGAVSLRKLAKTVKDLGNKQPDLKSVWALQKTAKQLANFKLPTEVLMQINESNRKLKEISEQWGKFRRMVLESPTVELQRTISNLNQPKIHADTQRKIKEISDDLADMRNRLAHQVTLPSNIIETAVPAYSLDRNNDDG